MCWQKVALLVLRRVGSCVGAKPNLPLVRLTKIELKKMCGGKNKKYRRFGNECRLTRCPFEIWSVCWSPVKMVCLYINVQFLVVCLSLHCRSLGLLITSYIRNPNPKKHPLGCAKPSILVRYAQPKAFFCVFSIAYMF